METKSLIVGYCVGIITIIIIIFLLPVEDNYQGYKRLKEYCNSNMQELVLNTDNKILECK
jgi:hypothetical protein